jgi:hypothetical protein
MISSAVPAPALFSPVGKFFLGAGVDVEAVVGLGPSVFGIPA